MMRGQAAILLLACLVLAVTASRKHGRGHHGSERRMIGHGFRGRDGHGSRERDGHGSRERDEHGSRDRDGHGSREQDSGRRGFHVSREYHGYGRRDPWDRFRGHWRNPDRDVDVKIDEGGSKATADQGGEGIAGDGNKPEEDPPVVDDGKMEPDLNGNEDGVLSDEGATEGDPVVPKDDGLVDGNPNSKETVVLNENPKQGLDGESEI